MAMHVTVDTLLDRVKDIAPMLRAYAAEAEAQRRLARPVVDAMRQAGLYSMSHPKAFGGLEVDPLTMFRVVEAVAYQDSAAGWNMQMSVGASCFLAWLPDEGAAEILTSVIPLPSWRERYFLVVRRSRWMAATVSAGSGPS